MLFGNFFARCWADAGVLPSKRMDSSDQKLLSRIADGDAQALSEFYDRHAPRIHGLLQRWVGQRDEAEDVLQDVFWKVWTGASRFDPQRGSPTAWLYMLARSRSIDALRRQASRAAVNGESELADYRDPAYDVDRLEQESRVREALLSLPDEQRRAIVRAFYSGMTYVEVARHESIPEGTAKTRIRRALAKLRDLLCEPSEQAP